MEKILEAKNLRISFRTNNGTVKAVRGINFSLNKGETLAIVGESGSGKSVTARAIMGILAGNAIVESGEILYDGRDLMKIPEDDFHQLRGNRISMIFQDPFSSLNPIMKVGRQLTEAMILNGKASQRDAKREFTRLVRLLSVTMADALTKKGVANAGARVRGQIDVLRKFAAEGNKLEKAYNTSRNWLDSLSSDIDGALIEILQGEPKAVSRDITEIARNLHRTVHKYLVAPDAGMEALAEALKLANKKYAATADREGVKRALTDVREQLRIAGERGKPDFFAMGYYLLYCDKPDTNAADIAALNERMHTYTEQHYMQAFLQDVAAAIELSHTRSMERKAGVIPQLEAATPVLCSDATSPAACRQTARTLIRAVEDSIDRLDVNKDSFAYTFRSSLNAALETYLLLRKLRGRNRRMLSRRNRLFVESGDLNLYRSNVENALTRLSDAYKAQQTADERIDYEARADRTVAYIRRQSSRMVYRVTPRIARKHAIDLMDEVGIPEPRKRYTQYPFQFSGGMRQRVVIAIALSANPDILICDEPTTALDVSIQAQILDLINSLKQERQLSVIFITHDLGVVANMADQIAVMYAGKIVEMGSVDEVFYEPAHPYTWALLASMPDLDTNEKLWAIPGTPPNMIYPPEGDAFAERNKFAMQIDFEQQPPEFPLSPTHWAATWLLHPKAPKVEPPKIVTDRIKRMRILEEVSGHA